VLKNLCEYYIYWIYRLCQHRDLYYNWYYPSLKNFIVVMQEVYYLLLIFAKYPEKIPARKIQLVNIGGI